MQKEKRDNFKSRLNKEISRAPVWEQYPPTMDVEVAIEIALEKIEEWDYQNDKHGWCHERPFLITLVEEALWGLELRSDLIE